MDLVSSLFKNGKKRAFAFNFVLKTELSDAIYSKYCVHNVLHSVQLLLLITY